jgi:hypothetical protein
MKTRKKPKPTRAPSAARVRRAATAAEPMVLIGVSWQQYEQLVELFAEDRVFMTYADGRLEFRGFPKLNTKLLLRWMKLGEAKGYAVMLKAARTWCEKQA